MLARFWAAAKSGLFPSFTRGAAAAAAASALFDQTINSTNYNFLNGGKTAQLKTSAGDSRVFSLDGKSAGDWYWEATPDASGGNSSAGIGAANDPVNGWSGVLDALYFLSGGLTGPGSPGGPYTAYTVGGASRPCFLLNLTASPPRFFVGLVNISTGVISWKNGIPGTSGGLDISSFTTPIHAICHATVANDQWTIRLAAADQAGVPPFGAAWAS